MKKVRSSSSMSKGILKKSERTSKPEISKKRFTKRDEKILSRPVYKEDSLLSDDDFILKFD